MKLGAIRAGKAGSKGRGVFATRFIRKGNVIETSPIIELSARDQDYIQKTLLNYYQFEVDRRERTTAIALGYASLYNHSYLPNATYRVNVKSKTITVIALRNLKPGEEILINYGYDAAFHCVEKYRSEVESEEKAERAFFQEDSLSSKDALSGESQIVGVAR